MIQAIGLTSRPRKELLTPPRRMERPTADRLGQSTPLLDDVSLEAHPGRVTALLGTQAEATAALRLMLELDPGRGITCFRGRPLHRIAEPSREVGVVLGEVPGHPGRTVRGHLRMLCAAAGVAVPRADEILEEMGLVSLRGEPLGSLSRGLDRRLAMACALLTTPHSLVLDAPTRGLPPREGRWLHGLLREHANRGGTVLFTTDDSKQAARTADRVITLDGGRVVADQEVGDFARTRLRPRVAVRSPHAARLSLLLTKEARAGRRSMEVVQEGGNRLSVYGSTCAHIGETAFRHGILIHQLADEIADMGPKAPVAAPEGVSVAISGPALKGTAPARTSRRDAGDGSAHPREAKSRTRPGAPGATSDQAAPKTMHPAGDHARPAVARQLMLPVPVTPRPGPASRPASAAASAAAPPPQAAQPTGTAAQGSAASSSSPPVAVRPTRGRLRFLRYEWYRATGVAAGPLTAAAVLVCSALLSVLLARTGRTPQPQVLSAWPRELPLPPAALGAGLLGALAYGEEFRHPALAVGNRTMSRRLDLLSAKLLVAAVTAVLFALLTVGCVALLLHFVYGPELAKVPDDWLSPTASWLCLTVGCAWAGVLAAGVFRSTSAGLAAVLAVPLVMVPLMHKVLVKPAVHATTGFSGRLRELAPVRWLPGAGGCLNVVVRMIIQPVGNALMLSLMTLFFAFLVMRFHGRSR